MNDTVSVDRFKTEDYFAKVDYLVSHLNRMWTRFNFFLTIEGVALSALVLSRSPDGLELRPHIAAIFAVISFS